MFSFVDNEGVCYYDNRHLLHITYDIYIYIDIDILYIIRIRECVPIME